MSWNEYSEPEHALFSPSQPAWINYDAETFRKALANKRRAPLGTELHKWAFIQIELGQKVSSKKEFIKSFRTFIFQKYYSDKYGLSKFGKIMLKYSTTKFMPVDTVSSYINDAISYKLTPEKKIRFISNPFSENSNDEVNFFGTSDAIKFQDNMLIIFDLKTGTSPVHIEQLMIYDALFCLNKKVDPLKIAHDLRIYQENDILQATPSGEEIKAFMDKIVLFDSIMAEEDGGNRYE